MRKVHDGKRKAILKMVMLVCIAVFVLVHPLSASADVIFEPENNFYERHSDECSYFDRSCLAGADTYLWDAPNLVTGDRKAQEGKKSIFPLSIPTRTELSGGWQNPWTNGFLWRICIWNMELRNS